MPLTDKPMSAEKIARFGGSQDPNASKLDYSVPLPGQQRNRRIMELSDVVNANQFNPAQPLDLTAQIGLTKEGATFTFNQDAAVDLWLSTAAANGVPGDKLAELQRYLAAPTQHAQSASRTGMRLQAETVREIVSSIRSGPVETSRRAGGASVDLVGLTPDPNGPVVPELLPMIPVFLEKLRTGVFDAPFGDPARGAVTQPTPVERQPNPRLFLVEEWAISSYLGDYGLGRTIKTMTLLPGEQLTMRFRTWRSTEQSTKDSSSVFDSSSTEAQDRFHEQVRAETTDKRTKTKDEEWHAEAKAKASWGWGSAEVSGGGSGQYHSGRERFAANLRDAVQEHARTQSNARETTVTSSTEVTEKREDEEVTDRVIRNVNLRNTLNFVFRELNQEYETYVHLLDIKIGYSDGTLNSWREVPVSDVRRLLADVLVDNAAVDQAAKAILKVAFRVFDEGGNPTTVLEKRTWDDATQDWSAAKPATLDGAGELEAPSATIYYRFIQGPLGTLDGKKNNKVEGVVLQSDTVTLRTDSVMGEALLGEADALDAYAMISQSADADAKAITNRRNNLVNNGLAALSDQDRVDAYVQMLQTGVARLELKQG